MSRAFLGLTPHVERLETRALLNARSVDLVVSAAALPASVSAGQRLSGVAVTVANLGTAPSTAPSFGTTVYLSHDNRLDPADVWVGATTHVGPIAPGGTWTAPANLVIPPDTPAGAKYLLVRANSRGAEPEADVTNNVRPFPVKVLVPDLRVADLTAQPEPARPGDTIALRWHDVNAGAGGAWGVYVDRVRVTDRASGAVLLERDIRVGDTRGSLGVGEAAPRRFSFVTPPGFAGRDLRITVTANADGRLAESNANNNAKHVDLATAPAAPVTADVALNDGGPQRSMIKSITVRFSAAVTLDPGAVRILHNNPGGAPPPVGAPSGSALNKEVAGVKVATSTVNGKTVAVLTFHAGAAAGGSLPDGRYLVHIAAAKVRGGRVFAGGGWTEPGGDQFLAFHRMFGDADGDGVVDRKDREQFLDALGRRRGQPGYRWYFDSNDDGVIDEKTDQKYFQRWYGQGPLPTPP